MQFIKLIIFTLLLVLVGCSSSKKKNIEEEPPKVIEEKAFEREYVLTDASTRSRPEWISNPSSGDTSENKKKYRYFVSESEASNKRLCLRSSEARASSRIAREIAQFMKNTYAEATQGGEDEEVSEYMQEQLAQEAQTFIVGAQTVRTYWEKRRYKVSLGASRDKINYACNALLKMSKRNLGKAIKNSRARLLRSIKDPEVKQKTQKAIAKVEEEFNKLDGPVQANDE